MIDRSARRVVVRVDANYDQNSACRTVPVLVRRALATVRPLLDQGASVVMIGSRGRPVNGPRDTFARIRANNPDFQFSRFADSLGQALGLAVASELRAMPTVQVPGYALGDQLTVLENLALDPREARNDQIFARQLAAMGTEYLIDDVRSLNDRTASIASMPKAVPTALSERVRADLACLDQLIDAPNRPLIAVVGGTQVARKLALIRRLGPVVDELLVTGDVANTFLAARGVDIRRTLIDASQVDTAKQLGGLFENKLVLPTDFVWRLHRIMDIGPKTRERFRRSIEQAASVLLTGPAGVVSLQLEAFHHGTSALIEALQSSRAKQRVVIGDDTVNLLTGTQVETGVTIVDGDAVALEYLATGKLVVLEAIHSSRFSQPSVPATLPKP